MTNSNKINTVRPVAPHEAAMLTELMRRAFIEAYASNTRDKDLKAHMEANFNAKRQQAELNNPSVMTLLAEDDNQALGYAQMLPGPAPECVQTRRPVQLLRFYLLKPFWGRGAADHLMGECLSRLSTAGYSAAWLSCWQKNNRALSFYRRWRFKESGTVPFIVGTDRQTDYIMVKALDSAGQKAL